MLPCLFDSVPLHVRKATLHDIPELVKIHSMCYRSPYSFESILEYHSSFIAIDMDTKRAVGYILLKPDAPIVNQISNNPCKSYFIEDLCIVPNERRKGYGSYLYNYSIQTMNCAKIACMAVSDSLPFWEAQGFEEVQSVDKSNKKDPENSGNSKYMVCNCRGQE